jgi:16S rRNA (cytosine967-C5)-methyltransferase
MTSDRGGRRSSSRQVALDVLRAVREEDAYANLVLPARIRDAGLSDADAALATELTYGTLRMHGLYDRVIGIAAGRELDRIDPVVLDILRLGIHQLFATRIPPHAAVGETVGLVAASGKRSATGFVNAVLRTVSRGTAESWRERAVAGAAGDERRSIATSHPRWIVAAVRSALDADDPSGAAPDAELDALLAADNTAPDVSLVALPGLAEPRDVGEPGAVSPIAARSAGGDPGLSRFIAAGTARVQDEGSQLAALALTRARPVVRVERWLDLCAGPGGKAAVLAAEARLGGAILIANEPSEVRAGLVRGALAPVVPAPEVWERDGRAIGAEQPGRFDRILLDAPCSGLGALRRRPEARWRKTADDLPGLIRLQKELLDSAIAALAPGGLLAYVTCSPHPAETREVVAAALRRHPRLRTLDTAAVVQAIALCDLDLARTTWAQLWPHRHGTDAMFIQLLTLEP